MKLSEEQIGSLLSLKRHERPPEGYMEDFVREFHHRRREEAAGRGVRASLWSRLTEWLAEPGLARWAYGAGVAYAAALAMVISLPRGQEVERPAPQPASFPAEAPADDAAPTQLNELDLRPSSEGTLGEQEF